MCADVYTLIHVAFNTPIKIVVALPEAACALIPRKECALYRRIRVNRVCNLWNRVALLETVCALITQKECALYERIRVKRVCAL